MMQRDETETQNNTTVAGGQSDMDGAEIQKKMRTNPIVSEPASLSIRYIHDFDAVRDSNLQLPSKMFLNSAHMFCLLLSDDEVEGHRVSVCWRTGDIVVVAETAAVLLAQWLDVTSAPRPSRLRKKNNNNNNNINTRDSNNSINDGIHLQIITFYCARVCVCFCLFRICYVV
jgi:hypothetical protein